MYQHLKQNGNKKLYNILGTFQQLLPGEISPMIEEEIIIPRKSLVAGMKWQVLRSKFTRKTD